MKNNTTKSAALAALVGLIGIGSAEAKCPYFTPIEKLAPEVRQKISSKILELTEDIDVDWDSIVVGVNENGEIRLCAKSDVTLPVVAGFSCASKASVENPTK